MSVLYDGNVFEEGVVREWLDEVREAVLWYLGQTHQPRSRAQPERRSGDGHIGRSENVHTKL